MIDDHGYDGYHINGTIDLTNLEKSKQIQSGTPLTDKGIGVRQSFL